MRFVNVFGILPNGVRILVHRRRVRGVASHISHRPFRALSVDNFHFLVTCELSAPFPFLVIRARGQLHGHRPSERTRVFIRDPFPRLPIRVREEIRQCLAAYRDCVLVGQGLSIRTRQVVLSGDMQAVKLLMFNVLFAVD